MVYFRRRRFFRRPFRRVSKFPRRRNFKRRGAFHRRAVRIVNAAAEKKYNFFNLANAPFDAITTDWAELHWLPTQGTSVLGRIGNKISISSISFRGYLRGGQSNSSADDKFNEVRMVCSCFRCDPKVDTTSVQSPICLSPAKANLSTRIMKDTYPDLLFKMYDKHFILRTPGRDSIGCLPAFAQFSYSHKFKKPIVINYDAVTGYPDKNLYFSVLADSAVVPNVDIYEGILTMHWTDV